MDRFFEALFLGLSTGAVYGLVALALVAWLAAVFARRVV